MKKNNKKEKGAALINVMLIVLLAVAIGLPLLYLVIVNFTFRMFDNNLRSISYKNEMGMDNVYAIIQEVVIGKTATARDKAKETVDKQVKAEQDAYKAWTDDGGSERADYIKSLIGTNKLDESADLYYENIELDFDKDDLIGPSDLGTFIGKKRSYLKDYMLEYGVITQEQYDDNDFEVNFKYIENDGTINSEAVKTAYNDYFKTYYKESMDGVDETEEDGTIVDIKSLNELLISKADGKGMKSALEETDSEQYAILSPDDKYVRYLPSNDTTSISVQVDYRGKSEATKKYVNSSVSATFTIGVPEFDSASSINQTTVQISNPLLDKTMVVGNAIDVADGKILNIDGSITIAGEVISEGKEAINVGKGACLDIDGSLAVNGKINLAEGESESKESKETKFDSTGDVFCEEIITAGEYTNTQIAKSLYIYDDMEIGNNNTTMNIGTLMAFNDIQPEEYVTLDGNEASKKSSAILFNNSKLENLSFRVGNAYIFGTAFVGDTKYKTGEGISVKGNYRAYQLPLAGDKDFPVGSIAFNDYSGLALAEMKWDAENSRWVDLLTEEKASYFMKVIKSNLINFDKLNGITIEKMSYSTGVWYNNGVWQDRVSDSNDNFAIGSNAAKDYEKYVKYFGYGEGNKYKLLDGEIPNVVGTNGWINSEELEVAADKYSDFITDGKTNENIGDDVVVLVSEGDLILTDKIDGKKGIIIAGGNITIEDNSLNVDDMITFQGTLICGGKLIVNDNFTLVNDSSAIDSILNSAISTDNKELFNLFRDDGSGNFYNYSTINTQIASINMNELIKISDWKKSKFDI